MNRFQAVYEAVLVGATVACSFWWLRAVVSRDFARGALTCVVLAGWLVFGYLNF
jgi:hypothetical protein